MCRKRGRQLAYLVRLHKSCVNVRKDSTLAKWGTTHLDYLCKWVNRRIEPSQVNLWKKHFFLLSSHFPLLMRLFSVRSLCGKISMSVPQPTGRASDVDQELKKGCGWVCVIGDYCHRYLVQGCVEGWRKMEDEYLWNCFYFTASASLVICALCGGRLWPESLWRVAPLTYPSSKFNSSSYSQLHWYSLTWLFCPWMPNPKSCTLV